ncbi:MAG: HDOD domain-containing protein [Pseudomonadota bacterium]
MTELLIVGPPDGGLATLQRNVSASLSDWNVLLCPHSDAALERIRQRPADVVLASLPSADDCESLFAWVAAENPGAIRLALFDSPPATVIGAHQVVANRSNHDDLLPVIQAAAEVSATIAKRPGLQKVMCRFQDVPSPPMLYFDIREQLDSATGNAATLAQIAGRDPALVARTLRIANSGFYARPRSVGDLTEAIGLIGVDTLLNLVLAASLYKGMPPPGLRLEALWQHAMEVSSLAAQIVRIEGGSREQINHGVIAGLLHDIGLLVLLQNEASKYQPLWRDSAGDEAELAVMEQAAFGATHGEVGALILKMWSLPPAVVNAVAHSHDSVQAPATDAGPLDLVGRAVMAAEWLQDTDHALDEDNLPAALADVGQPSLQRWVEARDELIPARAGAA